MTDEGPVWGRPAFEPTKATVAFDLYCFSPGPLDLGQGSPADDGWCPYGSIPDWLDIGVYQRETAPALFERLVDARFPGLDACQVVELRLADPEDLGHLQVAWATVRWLLGLGALVVYDDAARKWHHREGVLAWPTPLALSLDRETSIILESEPTAGRGQFMHTRGMRKFGRPDLVMELQPGAGLAWQVQQAGEVMGAMRESLAAGHVLRPGRSVCLGEATFGLEAYDAGRGDPDLVLENVALKLVRKDPFGSRGVFAS